MTKGIIINEFPDPLKVVKVSMDLEIFIQSILEE
jgi:hypothetical protein